jgi:hypothetical protein
MQQRRLASTGKRSHAASLVGSSQFLSRGAAVEVTDPRACPFKVFRSTPPVIGLSLGDCLLDRAPAHHFIQVDLLQQPA